MQTWDAILVGAGPAGCAAAYDLATAGHSVLLLDRAAFPRAKACAGGLTSKTVAALRYPVDPVVRRRLNALTIERDGDHRTVLRRRRDYCFMTVREELDAFCLEKTLAAGARFQRIRAIEAIEEEPDGVALRVDGERLRARYLVGADGVHSQVRRMTDPGAETGPASWFWRAFALEGCVKLSGREADELIFDFAPVRDGYGWFFPKGDHVNVGLYSYDRNEKIDRARLAAYVQERCGSAMLERVMGQYAGFGAGCHQPQSPRIFLVGDAGGFVDPLTGEGIYFAIVSGQAAAGAIVAGLVRGAEARQEFLRRTAKLRADLALATSGARWFYGHLDRGYRLLSSPLLRGAALRAFAEGMNLAALARGARKLALE